MAIPTTIFLSSTCSNNINTFWSNDNAASWTQLYGCTSTATAGTVFNFQTNSVQLAARAMTAPNPGGNMDPGVKAQWLRALRDGSYTQRLGGFKGSDPKNGCVLQVLMWVTGKERRGSGEPLPWTVLGIPDAIAAYLMTQNDSGITFADLANWIEANIKTKPAPAVEKLKKDIAPPSWWPFEWMKEKSAETA